jgi:hypothetical protein
MRDRRSIKDAHCKRIPIRCCFPYGEGRSSPTGCIMTMNGDNKKTPGRSTPEVVMKADILC